MEGEDIGRGSTGVGNGLAADQRYRTRACDEVRDVVVSNMRTTGNLEKDNVSKRVERLALLEKGDPQCHCLDPVTSATTQCIIFYHVLPATAAEDGGQGQKKTLIPHSSLCHSPL